jgi:hypothetical protein
MMRHLICPNEKDGDSLEGEHQFFLQKRHRTELVTLIGNGRRWALDAGQTLDWEDVGPPKCETCGAEAIVEEE